MPLAFESESHGIVAFGFFNIETDMLLLEHYFFFAEDFCREISRLAVSPADTPGEKSWEVYDVSTQNIGDLHGAISGTRLVGFIGEVYHNFPFPEQPEAFKQNPAGVFTRPIIENIIVRYGKKTTIALKIDEEEKSVAVGEYLFTFAGFRALIQYVWRGGYPRWKDEKHPDYVMRMKTAIEKSSWKLFEGIELEL